MSRHYVLLDYEIKKIREHENHPEEEHVRLKQEKATEQIRFAKRHSSFYRNLYKDVNLQDSFSNFYKIIPHIYKHDIIKHRNEICTTLPFFT